MDKDVIVEFVKNVAIGSAQIVGVFVAIFLAVNIALWAGVDPKYTVPVVMIGFLVVMFLWLCLSTAWDSAKSKVEYERKWGEKL